MSEPTFYRSDLPPKSSINTAVVTSIIPKKSVKFRSLTGYTLVLSGAVMSLIGCQSSGGLSATAQIPQGFYTPQQAQAFNAQLDADSAHYAQLFESSTYPNNETQAKLRLLSAIRQHLATEHVAVSKARYNAAPWVQSDSIDAESSSVLKTMLEVYAYKNTKSDENSFDENSDDDIEDDDGFDENGYDESSDKENYDTNSHDENGYDEYGYDEYGYDNEGYDENGYDENANQREQPYGNSSSLFAKFRMFSSNTKDWLRNYEAMQAQKQLTNTNVFANSGGVVSQLLAVLHRTPEQIAAQNAYHYQPMIFNSVSHYKPAKKQIESVYSYDYLSPSTSSSLQIPLKFDFNHSRVTLDPSALMPVMALVNPEQTPLPKQMAAHTVDFGLPESITSQIPAAVIYDALLASVQNSMAEISPENFSAVDIRGDDFAQQLGAHSAVKIYFGSQQTGEMVGKMLKYFSQSLTDYVAAHPDNYPDDAPIKAALDKIQTYQKGYQSSDVGALLQLIEAISPLSFNHTNYYYLDSNHHLLGKQQRNNVGGDLLGANMQILKQTRYDAASFRQHELTPLLMDSFDEKAAPAIDGDAWRAQAHQKKEQLTLARYARYDYDYQYDDQNNNQYDDEDTDTLAAENEQD